MEELEDNSVDVIVTSPPYNRDKTYSSDTGQKYNDKRDESQYLAFLKKIWTECLRVATDKAVFFLNIGDSASDQGISEKVAMTAEEAGWIRIQDIIWVKSILGKGHYTPSGGKKRLNNIWEHVYMFAKNKKKYRLQPKEIGIPYADKSNIGRYSDTDKRDAGNVWLINYEKTTGATIKKGHEAPFPIGLPYRCIKLVPKVKRVLDPFGGTCTTLAACLKLGVKGMAYEKYPRTEVIRGRILEGKNFEEEPVNLLPHLEESIKLIISLFPKLGFDIPKIKTKKRFLKYKILLETLKNLRIKGNVLYSRLTQRLLDFEKAQKELKDTENALKQKTL